MTVFGIDKIFRQEFKSIARKFTVIEVKVKDARTSTKEFIWHPGVYVFLLNDKVIKVGRHLTNSRKRALEHIQDNTHNNKINMRDLRENEDAILLLFNVKDTANYHWVAALEIFLEDKLKPAIKSGRKG